MPTIPEYLDRLPPHNIEAEQATLGAIMLDNDILTRLEELLDPSDFFRRTHRSIYAAALHIRATQPHAPIDLLSLRDVLEQRDQLDEIGGPAYLAALVDVTPTAANVEYHAGIIRDTAKKRRLYDACLDTIKAIQSQKVDDNDRRPTVPFQEIFTEFNDRIRALDFDKISWVRTRNGIPAGIHEAEYVRMLESYGFRVAKYNGKLEFVHTHNRMVETLEWYKNACVSVKHSLREKFEQHYPALWELLLKAHKFDYKALTSLSAIEQAEFLEDDRDTCRIAYANGVVSIRRDGVTFTPHTQNGPYMWTRQMCPRDYHGLYNLGECALDFRDEQADELNRFSEIEQFILHASSQELENGEMVCNREIFEYAIGFAAWHYNDVANPKAVVIIDCDPSDFSDGRRGKGIILQMLRAIIGDGTPDGPVTNLNGKSLSGQFKFQRVTPQTTIMMIDDVDPSMVSFEQFYSDITEGLISEGKGLQQFAFTPETTPKMIFTSNKPFFGIERSTSDRMLLLPMTDFFALEGQKPMQYFGHRLFKDWNDKEWARFDDYMIRIIQRAMQHDPMNLPKTDLSVFNANRIYLDLDETFVRFMDEVENDMSYERDSILDQLEANKVTFKRGQFKKALETYARLRGRKLYTNTKDRRYKIGAVEYIMFTTQADMREGFHERIHEQVKQAIERAEADKHPFGTV